MKKLKWKKYGFEFLSIFIAVISAYALNNWNARRIDNNAEDKILTEIVNGLKKDIDDIRINRGGHEEGIGACGFWRNVIANKESNFDSLLQPAWVALRDQI